MNGKKKPYAKACLIQSANNLGRSRTSSSSKDTHKHLHSSKRYASKTERSSRILKKRLPRKIVDGDEKKLWANQETGLNLADLKPNRPEVLFPVKVPSSNPDLGALKKTFRQTVSLLKPVKIDSRELVVKLEETNQLEVHIQRLITESCVLLKLLPILEEVHFRRLHCAFGRLVSFLEMERSQEDPIPVFQSKDGWSASFRTRVDERNEGWIKQFNVVLLQLVQKVDELHMERQRRTSAAIKLQCFVRKHSAARAFWNILRREIKKQRMEFWRIFEPLLSYVEFDSANRVRGLCAAGMSKPEAKAVNIVIDLCVHMNEKLRVNSCRNGIRNLILIKQFLDEDADRICECSKSRRSARLQRAYEKRQEANTREEKLKEEARSEQLLRIRARRRSDPENDLSWIL